MIENYERIIDPIITYRKYSKALKAFSIELGVQRDIFQNECVWLLSELVDAQELEDMLEEPSHALRSTLRDDLGLSREFSRRLDLSAGLSRPERTKAESIDFKAWHHHLRQKVKLSFGRPSLNEKVNDLRHRNQAFLAISRQVVRFNGYMQSSAQVKQPMQVDRDLEKLQKMRAASQRLYQVLTNLWSCPEHTEHSANLRLCSGTSELPAEPPSKISFGIAVTYWGIEQPTLPSEPPFLLVIESTVDEDASTTESAGKAPEGEIGGENQAQLQGVIDSLQSLG
ncbi:hypothetical protein FGG08_004281 [Glutinoglossum americanum]|uniref:Uncharacterized protein n=1 Tax=Glutinoglossum americanum TaxID=1670608 RepID=A0A9P8HWQ0_9PEZI|nr:hypothetical protein FGG08_004281 [Glutinoglossum americanum]